MKVGRIVLLALTVTLSRADVSDEFTQAEALQRAKRWAEARGAFEALLPKLEGALLADALNKIGYGYERDRRQHEQAIAMHCRALAVPEATPSSRGYAWLRIGYCARRPVRPWSLPPPATPRDRPSCIGRSRRRWRSTRPISSCMSAILPTRARSGVP